MYAKIDRKNAEAYKKGKKFYRCVCCQMITELSDSISYQGYNLICDKCRNTMMQVLNTDNLVAVIQKVGERNKHINNIVDTIYDKSKGVR